MDIKQIFQLQSEWTWNVMAASAQLGEMIREDAITSVNLSFIAALTEQAKIRLSITSFQGARLESEFGGDWLWVLNQSAYLVQAKRLDVIASMRGMTYTINIPQLALLVDASQSLSGQHNIDNKPMYVFYNSMLDNLDPKEAGCTMINAIVLQNYLTTTKKIKSNQQSATVTMGEMNSLGALPWYHMFVSG